MYSDMSIRTMARSSSNMNSASARRRHVALVDPLLDEPRLELRPILELLLEFGEQPVADLGHARELAVPLRALGLHPQLVDLPRDLLDAVELGLLLGPHRGEAVAALLRVGELALHRRAHLLRLLRPRRKLDLELAHAPLGLIELDRRG